MSVTSLDWTLNHLGSHSSYHYKHNHPKLSFKVRADKLSTLSSRIWRQHSHPSFCTVKLKWSPKTCFKVEGNSNVRVSVSLPWGVWNNDNMKEHRVIIWTAEHNQRTRRELTPLWCNPERCGLTPHWMITRTPEKEKEVYTDYLVPGN